MRTKALLCAAALAASAAISMAQNVYSLNVVGYINLTLQPGLTLIANQLDADGYMTNNYVTNVFGSSLPTGSALYAFTGSGYAQAKWTGTKWTGAAAVDPYLAPGKGLFVSIPAASSAVTLTLVGQVIQGTNSTPINPGGGLAIVSSIAPIAGGIQTVMGYPPVTGDVVYQYASGYVQHKWTGTKWTGGEPSLAVGESAFLATGSGNTATTWTQVFNVQ